MRVCLVIPALRNGGAERIMCHLANGWIKEGHEVHLITLDSTQTSDYYLDPQVQLYSLQLLFRSRNFLHAIYSNIQRLYFLRKIIKEITPDLIVSFLLEVSVLSLLAGKFLGIPTIVSIRQNHEYEGKTIWRWFRDRTYPWARFVVLLTESQKRNLEHKPWNIQVINNPVLPCPSNFSKNTELLNPCIITVARLEPQKRLDLLIQAFSNLKDKHPQWQLHIYGKGVLLNDLQRQVEELGLNGRVHFQGYIHDIHSKLKQADIFALTSDYESFCNALAEAMSCGLAVVSTRCNYGPDELISSGRDGLLVPVGDVEAFTNALDTVMSDPDKRVRMGRNAAEIIHRYPMEKFLAQWNALVKQIKSS